MFKLLPSMLAQTTPTTPSPEPAEVPEATGIGLGDGASTFVQDVDPVWNFLFWTSVFFTVLIVGALIFFIFRYRQKHRDDHGKGPSHSTPLELFWTGVPLVLVLIFFALGFRGYVHMSTIDQQGQAEPIVVESFKWGWNFVYADGTQSPILYVPNDRPIQLTLQSTDVIHSFYVPAFRVKKDCVPGRYNQTWFKATKNGTYDLFCAEYCGQQHSAMITTVEVMDREDFLAKLEELNDPYRMSPVELGRQMYEQGGCKQCHSIDGSAGTGPTFQNIYGKQENVMVDGQQQQVLVDAEYLRESIDYPGRKIVMGYQNVMPSYKGRFHEAQYIGFIEYIKSISSATYSGPVMGEWENQSSESEEGEAEAPEADEASTSEEAETQQETSNEEPLETE